MKSKDGIREAYCSRCGKYFIVQPLNQYKKGSKKFCSFGCHDAFLNELEEKKKNKKKARATDE